MAIVRAVKTGVWSDPTTWNTGALPTSADDVYSNTFSVTIDISPTVLSISNASTTGVTAGGQFLIAAAGISLACTATNGIVGSSVATSCLAISNNTGAVTLTSNLLGGSSTSSAAVAFTGAGTLNIVGNIPGGVSGPGLTNSSSGTVNITGSITGSVQTSGLTNSSTGVVNVTGPVTGGSNTGTQFGITNTSAGVVNVTGNVFCGTGSGGAPGINNVSGTVTVVGQMSILGNLPALQSSGASATVILTGPFLTNSNGVNPVYAARWFWANSNVSPTYYQIRTQNLATIRPLYTADSVGGNPAVSNVRLGTVYGPNNDLTGTLAMPSAQSVRFGVPVDNTTGTAALSPQDIWNYPLSGITTSGSIGERLKNAATVSSVSSILSNALR